MTEKNIIKERIKKSVIEGTYDSFELYKQLQENFDITVSSLLNSVFYLFKHNTYNHDKIIEDIISLFNRFISDDKNNKLYLKLSKKINIFLDNTSKYLKKQQLLQNEKYFRRFFNIQNKCLLLPLGKNKMEKYFFMKYLIFDKKDVLLLHRYMANNTKVLANSVVLLKIIFTEVLEKFVSLDENDIEEIKYYNQVINVFMRGKIYTKLLEDNDKSFMKILEMSNKDFVIKERMKIKNNFFMTKEEVAKEYNVSFLFPKDLEKIAYTSSGLVDFTNQDIITIDEKEDRCLDDALFIEKNSDGTYTFYIHLANIPSLISYDSKIMKEALRRGETIFSDYFNIHIFEEYLADGLLSILPNKKTNTLTFVMKVDPHFTVLLDTVKIVPGVVINRHKLSYSEVDEMLESGDASKTYDNLVLLSELMNKLSKDNLHIHALHKIDNIIWNKDNADSAKAKTSKAHKMVENSMIFANRLPDMISKYYHLDLPLGYRAQPTCNDAYIEMILKSMSFPWKINSNMEHTIKVCMGTSFYTPKDIYHDGLKINGYARISSPARRALDALNEFVIYDLYLHRYDGDLDKKQKYWEDEVKYWSDYMNKRINENSSFMTQYSYLHERGKILTKKKENN